MSDFLNRLTLEDAPEPREVTIGDETGTVYFRKISAGQREAMLKGTVVRRVPGEQKGTVDVDLGANEHQRQLLVMYSVCDENGKRYFKNEEAVKKLPADKLTVLSNHAAEVNKSEEEDEPGKD